MRSKGYRNIALTTVGLWLLLHPTPAFADMGVNLFGLMWWLGAQSAMVAWGSAGVSFVLVVAIEWLILKWMTYLTAKASFIASLVVNIVSTLGGMVVAWVFSLFVVLDIAFTSGLGFFLLIPIILLTLLAFVALRSFGFAAFVFLSSVLSIGLYYYTVGSIHAGIWLGAFPIAFMLLLSFAITLVIEAFALRWFLGREDIKRVIFLMNIPSYLVIVLVTFISQYLTGRNFLMDIL